MARVYDPDPVRSIRLSSRFALFAMEESDLGQVLALERDSFLTPWTREGFLVSLRTDFGRAWVALDRDRQNRTVVGYLCCWVKPGSVRLVNICVARSYRRQGLGRAMMRFLISHAKLNNTSRIKLEARRGNRPAIKLYQKLGFQNIGSASGYYFDTGEEALFFELDLSNDRPPDRVGSRSKAVKNR